MAGNAKAIRTRIRSVESTMHITKAMQLVASSKLRRATERMEKSRFFFETMTEAFSDFGSSLGDSVYARRSGDGARVFVMIAGDRGLAGGYNSNLFKSVREAAGDAPYSVLPIGKKAVEYCRRRGIPAIAEYSSLEDIDMRACAEIGALLAKGFQDGRFSEIKLFFTSYVSVLSQSPCSLELLPLRVLETKAEKSKAPHALVLFEPSEGAVLEAVMPEYLSGLVYGATCESYASELAARRTAMDSATGNAEAMIEDLSLRYNRARQSAITQEITEIIGGSEAE